MPFEPMEVILVTLGFSIGFGLIAKEEAPHFFYLIVAPLISAIAMVMLLEHVPAVAIEFDFDRLLRIVFKNQAGLAKSAMLGAVVGVVSRQIVGSIFRPRRQRKRKARVVVDTNISMRRRQHLRTLGLTNTAGPRDMFLAWTRLSNELQGPDWEDLLNKRGLDCSAEEFKDWLDEAYAWLRENSAETGRDSRTHRGLENQRKERAFRFRSLWPFGKDKVNVRGL